MTCRSARLAMTLAIMAIPVVVHAAEPPGDSLYQLNVSLTTQQGKQVPLAAFRGHPVLITMFYASCVGVCPTIAFTMRRMEAALTPPQRRALRAVMVSFDPEHDSNRALAEFARLSGLDDSRWSVTRTPAKNVRDLAAALGVRYRPLPGGSFNHTTLITLLDSEGVPKAHTEQLSTLDPEFMHRLREILSDVAARVDR